MFAKFYSYLWGEETEAENIPENQVICGPDEEIVEINSLPSQTDENKPNGHLIDEHEVENGWVHVKDYKVEPLSDNESIIAPPVNQNLKKKNSPSSQKNMKCDKLVMKTRVTKKNKEVKNREVQNSTQRNNAEELSKYMQLWNNDDNKQDNQPIDRRMTRKAMKMSNLNMIVNSSSNKPSRRRFHYTPTGFSGVVNNRKC